MPSNDIDFSGIYNELFSAGLRIIKDKNHNLYGMFYSADDSYTVHSLPSHSFDIEFKRLYYNVYNTVLQYSDLMSLIQFIELDVNNDYPTVDFANRVYIDENGTYVYELNRSNACVCIEDGELDISTVDGVVFKHNVDYADQVIPNLDVEPSLLFDYVRKHFNIKSNDEIIMFSLYLVTNFWGLSINHPILVLTGEKGSSKSTTMRKLELLVDPKSSDLLGIPKGSDGLEIRLSNSYFVALDNLSTLTTATSNILARSVTGGSTSKRLLYSNNSEIVMDIKAIVVINGVSLVAKESDLLDRSLIITLDRIEPGNILTEKELWADFEKDRPDILGCCFNALAVALCDDTPIESKEKIRMADFYVACVKIGRALGIPESEVSRILWKNQEKVNKQSIDEDIVGLCIIELMSDRIEYRNSVTGLLQDLTAVAECNGLSWTVLPKLPNQLSKRLNKLKSNLESSYGIYYKIVNVGTFKEIRIKKE